MTLVSNARQLQRCVLAFNVYTLDQAAGILDASEANDAAVILQLQLPVAGTPASAIVSGLDELGRSSAVEVGLHLDHADPAVIADASSLSFDSVMVDGSRLPFPENVSTTKRVVDLERTSGRGVEGELGRLTGSEDGVVADREASLTDPLEAAAFVASTSVASLAVCIGNVHGLTPTPPVLELDRLSAIAARVPVPLVLHGASGLTRDVLRETIAHGVAKINVNAEVRHAYKMAIAPVAPDEELVHRLERGRAAAAAAAAAVYDRLGLDVVLRSGR